MNTNKAKNSYSLYIVVIVSTLQLVGASCYCMKLSEQKMPSAEVLKKRLAAYPQLLKNNDLIEHIADKRLVDCNVVWYLDLALYDYAMSLKAQKLPKGEIQLAYEQLDKERPCLLCLLLQDFPDVIRRLKNTAAFKPTNF